MILTIDSNYFVIEHSPDDLSNGGGPSCLGGKDGSFVCYLN
jgi:hypothetical protein